MSVREIEYTDLTIIMDGLVQMKDESPTYKDYPTDIPYTAEIVSRLIKDHHFIGVIDRDYRGFMFGYGSMPWYSPVYEANEMTLFVHKEFRGSPVSVQLIAGFERTATEHGCEAINVGASTGIADIRVEQLYLKLGYVRKGYGLTKRIK